MSFSHIIIYNIKEQKINVIQFFIKIHIKMKQKKENQYIVTIFSLLIYLHRYKILRNKCIHITHILFKRVFFYTKHMFLCSICVEIFIKTVMGLYEHIFFFNVFFFFNKF